MEGFDERLKGFEARFQRDLDLTFRLTARRNRLFGLWAANRLGLSGEEAEAYARTVVAADFETPDDDDVIAKVLADFAGHGASVSAGEARSQLAAAVAQARKQLLADQAA